ncbi:MAG TPA: hypothetical protein VMF62_01495, partial [Acetobacteraceae bacterium]|nr:hypothetical protein [Acetobacteraceae bacterium]
MIAVLLACSGAAGKAFAQDQAGSAGGTAPEAGSTGASGQTGAGPGAAAANATGTATENAAETTVAPAPGLAATAAPPVGVAVRLGDLGSILAAASSLGTAQLERPPGLTITPSVGLQEEFTTNVFGTTGGGGDDFITSLTPGLLVNLATPKATGTLSYAPTFSLYANHSSDNNIAENLNGALDATILPQTLLFSLRAYASEQSTAGGVAPGGTATLSTNNQTTNFGFSASPTFQHRFGDTGTLSLGYSLDYTNQNGNAAFAAGASQPYFLSSRTLTNQETGSFTTGPDLGRFNDTLAANGAQSSGTGVL